MFIEMLDYSSWICFWGTFHNDATLEVFFFEWLKDLLDYRYLGQFPKR